MTELKLPEANQAHSCSPEFVVSVSDTYAGGGSFRYYRRLSFLSILFHAAPTVCKGEYNFTFFSEVIIIIQKKCYYIGCSVQIVMGNEAFFSRSLKSNHS